MKGLGWRLEIRKNFCVYCMCSQTETVKEAGRMNTQNMKDTAKGIFTAKRIKIGVAVLVVCAIAAGGGAWYMHQQKWNGVPKSPKPKCGWYNTKRVNGA